MERARLPGLASSTVVMRRAECHRISIAGAVTAFSKDGHPRKAESGTALGRFEGEAWVPAASHLSALILQPKMGEAAARRRRSS
jgi:hypothetical protein